MLRAVLSKWRETALWMFPDATQAGTSCTFECFRDDGDRGESWFRLVESEGDGNGGGDWLAEETGDGPGAPGEKKIDHTARGERRPRCSNFTVNARLRQWIVGTNIRALSRVKHRESCWSVVRRTSKQERCVKTLVK